MTTRHPLGGPPLADPPMPPLRVFAIWNADQPCTEHSVAFTGQVPCTGRLRCHICGTEWDPRTGNPITYRSQP